MDSYVLWARGALKKRHLEYGDYMGLSYAELGARAQAICGVAGETGEVLRAAMHLYTLTFQMQARKEIDRRKAA